MLQWSQWERGKTNQSASLYHEAGHKWTDNVRNCKWVICMTSKNLHLLILTWVWQGVISNSQTAKFLLAGDIQVLVLVEQQKIIIILHSVHDVFCVHSQILLCYCSALYTILVRLVQKTESFDFQYPTALLYTHDVFKSRLQY